MPKEQMYSAPYSDYDKNDNKEMSFFVQKRPK